MIQGSFAETRGSFAETQGSFVETQGSFTETQCSFVETRSSLAETRDPFPLNLLHQIQSYFTYSFDIGLFCGDVRLLFSESNSSDMELLYWLI